MQNSGDLPTIPQADLVFLALGSNDALLQYDSYYYGEQLRSKLARTKATVYCVLPIVSPTLPAQAFRNKMLQICDNVIDPIKFGVNVFDDRDMQHWDNSDHTNFVNALISTLTNEGFIKTPTEAPTKE